jgi:CMP-N-acetylneuraminic acid synthetase
MVRALAIVPARGGSKGIPRKNLRELAGHPLLAWSIAAAEAAETVGRIIVSTDDAEIAEVAREYGAETPFLRPAALAADETRDLPVFQHALAWLAEHEGERPDVVVHLRPTSPLRRAADIDRAVRALAADPLADAVRSVCAPFQNPYKMWRLGADGALVPLLGAEMHEPYNAPHQTLPSVYWQTGYIDVVRRRTIVEQSSMTGRRIAPLVVDPDSWVDIDSVAMLEYAEFLIRSGRVTPAAPRRAAVATRRT